MWAIEICPGWGGLPPPTSPASLTEWAVSPVRLESRLLHTLPLVLAPLGAAAIVAFVAYVAAISGIAAIAPDTTPDRRYDAIYTLGKPFTGAEPAVPGIADTKPLNPANAK